MRASLLLLPIVLGSSTLFGQTDSSDIQVPLDSAILVTPGSIVVLGEAEFHKTDGDTIGWRQRHIPRRATLLSAVVPGAGQIYNRKYWKAPIVWTGLGISYYFVQRNQKEYRRFQDNYLAVIDNDPTTVDEYNGTVSASQLLDATDTYRRWRDLSYVAVGLCYMLNVVDATVDAHFVRFDVGRELSMGIAPSLETTAMGAPGLSLALTLR